MKCKKLLPRVISSTLVLLLLVACSTPQLTPDPRTNTTVMSTPTSIPSTATPIPPTATPIPPTATPVPPTATPIPPTATPDVAPVVTLTGRLLFADSEKPVADTSVYITGEAGKISFVDGFLVNPSGDTDSTGRFKVEIPEDFLRDQDYKIMVLVGLQPKMVPILTQDGAMVVLKIESVPSENDMGDVLVQR